MGKKQFEGDFKTPEGIYFIDSKNENSAFYKNLGISYPSENDIQFALQSGRSPGNNIKIHGLPNGYYFIGKFHRLKNWTAGCIAVTNFEMKQLFESVEQNAIIEIFP